MPEMLKMDPFAIGNSGPNATIQVQTGEVSTLFQGSVILHPSVAANEVGCFTLGSIGRNNAVLWNFMNGPKHLFKPRQNGCAWDPKGGVRIDTTKVSLESIEVQIEQCVDALWKSCWEKLLGVGVDVRKMLKTEEGRKLLQFLVQRVFDSMRNSTSNLVWWGKNAFISQSTTNHWYASANGTEEIEWADFVEQQDILPGMHTHIASGASTYSHWNIAIASGDVSGNVFTGVSNSIVSYFESVVAGSTRELRALYEVNPEKVAFYVMPAEFKAYKLYLEATYGSIPESYFMLKDGLPNRNVLMYNGVPVVNMREWAEFDHIVGVNHHMIYLAARGVFGIAHDVNSIDERGIGLEMTTWDQQPYKGKTFIDTDFQMGTGILDNKLVSRAHITLTPAAL